MPSASAADSKPSKTTGNKLIDTLDFKIQSVFRVLQTFRSREPIIAAFKRSGWVESLVIIQAPPVPCKLTGTPACWAMPPSIRTASHFLEPQPNPTQDLKTRPKLLSVQIDLKFE